MKPNSRAGGARMELEIQESIGDERLSRKSALSLDTYLAAGNPEDTRTAFRSIIDSIRVNQHTARIQYAAGVPGGPQENRINLDQVNHPSPERE